MTRLKKTELILVCVVGGQATLTGKTLIDMGYTNVSHVGTIGDWEKRRSNIQILITLFIVRVEKTDRRKYALFNFQSLV